MDDRAITFNTLPALGAPLEGGTFAGLITLPNGTHNAVVLLPVQGGDLTWQRACEWAKQHGGVLPTRHVVALLFANIRDWLQPGWHWTADERHAPTPGVANSTTATRNTTLRALPAQLLPSA